MSTEADTATPALMCMRHPRIPATFTCDKCGAGMCNMCGFGKPAGSRYCANCVSAMAPASAAAPAAAIPQPSAALPPSLTPPPLAPRPMQPQHWTNLRVPPGKLCALHTTVQAVDYCSSCGAFMCGVCSFDVPGMAHHHVCPTCVVNPPATFSKSRRTFVIVGLLFAVATSAALVGLMTGTLVRFLNIHGEGSAGMLFVVMSFLAILGFAFSSCAQERNLPNPAVAWVAVIWNSLLLAAFLFLYALGVLRVFGIMS